MFLFFAPFWWKENKISNHELFCKNYNALNITMSSDLTTSQCFPDRDPQSLWKFYIDCGNLFKLYKVLNKFYLNTQIKENIQYKKGLFYLKNEFICNLFAKETVAEKKVSQTVTFVACHSIYNSIIAHFYQ